LRGYYLYDLDPNASLTNSLPHNRDRVTFSYLATPWTNTEIRSLVRYQSDLGVSHDFFESEFRQDPQPSTYLEVNKFWQNFSLDAYAQPRINDWLETVEKLPDIRLEGYRQQIAETPIYYETESSTGWYRRLFPQTNGTPYGLTYSAARADTFHQFLLPETFFGWLNFTPHIGGRFTYYSHADGPGATTDEIYRKLFNTGAELTFKASQVWPEVKSKWLDLDGVRHIIEPMLDYEYVPTPNRRPGQIPQFDFEQASLRLLPINFPDYNSIDSIDSENVLRIGLRNKLQTKRNDSLADAFYWDIYTDWRLQTHTNQSSFADIFSDAVLRPRSWFWLESVTRFEPTHGDLRLAFHSLTLQPGDRWSWTIGHFYTRDDFSDSTQALGEGNSLLTTSFFFKLNENWAFSALERYSIRNGRAEEQFYSVYRDFRSWTGALIFRLRENQSNRDDFTVAVTFSLKAAPRYALGSDAVKPYYLLGR
jgi:hypothetical protein